MREHVVYLIGPEIGDIKVGYSGNLPQRLKQLQTGHPDRLSILYKKVLPSEREGRLVEDMVHKRLHAFRREGEWFGVTLDLAKDVLDRIHLNEGYDPDQQQRQLEELSMESNRLRQEGSRISAELAAARAELDRLNNEFMENLKQSTSVNERLQMLKSINSLDP